MSIITTHELHIYGATFEHNEATSGGGVSVVATAIGTSTAHDFKSCLFDGNIATDGGALYLFNKASAGNVEDTVFRRNIAGTG